MQISLRELMGASDGWGHRQGRQLQERLLAVVGANPKEKIFRISLAGVRRTDASFPRESVLALAKRFREELGFCLVDATDPDLLENWDAAAVRLRQPLIAWNNFAYRVLGPPAPEGTRLMLEYILSVEDCTAAEAAAHLGLQLSNASNKLRKLFADGYIIRSPRTAPTGGIEHIYCRIR